MAIEICQTLGNINKSFLSHLLRLTEPGKGINSQRMFAENALLRHRYSSYLEFESQKTEAFVTEGLICRELQTRNKTPVYEYHVNDFKP